MAKQRKPTLRQLVLTRDGYRCVYCSATPHPAYLQMDHVVPRALGGETTLANLVTACGGCNRRKSAKAIPVSANVRRRLAAPV